MSDTFWQDRLTACQNTLIAAQDLLLVLLSDDTPQQKAYTLNTGQSTVSVTKADLGKVYSIIDALMNQCAVLDARVNGATIHGRPGW
jgi:hypothetical protein